MARQKLDDMKAGTLGIAAWVLVTELMSKLRAKRLISEADGAEVIDDALALAERLDEVLRGPSLNGAREILADYLNDWHHGRPKPKRVRLPRRTKRRPKQQ